MALVLQACTEKQPAVLKDPAPTDSFTVSGIASGQQVQGMQYLSDTLLCSYDPAYKDLTYFSKKEKTYKAGLHRHIDVEPWSSFFTGPGRNYFISRSNVLTVYDQWAGAKLMEVPLKCAFRYLKDTFQVVSDHDSPVMVWHDTIMASFVHGNLAKYTEQFKEPEMAEFKLYRDSLKYTGSYFAKPAGLSHFCFPFSKYAVKGNDIYLVYPCYDTIYHYNRASHSLHKQCIHNKDYRLPAHWDPNMLWKVEYNSYQTAYDLKTFSYAAICYNALSGHFILFYYPPVPPSIGGRQATPDDKKLMAVVLDEELKVTGYYLFTKPYVYPGSYFYVPGKGIAMPIFKGLDDYDTTLFYIHNL